MKYIKMVQGIKDRKLMVWDMGLEYSFIKMVDFMMDHGIIITCMEKVYYLIL